MSTWDSETSTGEARLAEPNGVPCLGGTVVAIAHQLAKYPSVQRAWISTIQISGEEPKLCVAIEVDSTTSNRRHELQCIVDQLMVIADEISPPEDVRYSEHILREELIAFTYFVANEGQEMQLSAGAGIPIYPLCRWRG
jgi:hypothetical protein